MLKELLGIVSISAVSEQEILKALELAWGDFEDSVQYAVALSEKMDALITRNPEDYRKSEIQIWLPEQALEAVK